MSGLAVTDDHTGVHGALQVSVGVPDWWDELAGPVPLLGTQPWLRVMSGRAGRQALTFSVPAGGGRPQVAMYGTLQAGPRPGEVFDLHTLVGTSADLMPLTAAARAARAGLDPPGPSRWTPSLVLMFPGYECFPVGPGGTDPATMDTLVGGLVAWARAAGVQSIGFLYMRPAAAALAGAAERHGFSEVPLTYSFDLPIPGPDFADYLAVLPSKRRREVRRELRRIADAGIELTRPPVGEVFDDLVRLRCALVRKYRGDVDVDNERTKLRRSVDEVAGGEPHVFCATAGGTVLSAAMFAGTDRDWTGLVTGTDPTDPRSRLCYFATTYYEPVRAAAARGARLLRYGHGSWNAKLSRGCQPTLMTAWVLGLDPDVAAAVRRSAASTAISL
jgi:hypothetical protein